MSPRETFEEFAATRRARVERELDRRLPPADAEPRPLAEAMRHSVFGGGKRIRPLLALAAARALDLPEEPALPAACALELLHTYSLIHDDLPCMDDAELRRGRPACHKAYGEAVAVLAGDALATLAFEVAAAPGPAPGTRAVLVVELTRAAGIEGMIGGQVRDLQAEGQPPDAATLDFIHRRKTGSLIRAAVRMGALAAGAPEAALAALTRYGECVGLAFQVVDDILDVSGDPRMLGKDARRDQDRRKMTFPALVGLDGARRRALELSDEASAAVAALPGRDLLHELARSLVERSG